MADPFYFSVVKFCRTMAFGLRIHMDVNGSQHIPRQGGAVLAINHTSFLDFIFAGFPVDEAGHRYVRFMAKDAVFRHQVAGPLMRTMKHIPVDRMAGAQAFDAAVDALRRGEIVGVFPEATMSRSFDIKDFKTGAVRMAAAAEVPLIPEIVFGGQRLYSYNHRDVTPGKAISVTAGAPMFPTTADNPEAVTAELRARMIVMLDEVVANYRDRPGPDEHPWWLPARLGGSAPTLAEAAEMEAQAKARKNARRAAPEG